MMKDELDIYKAKLGQVIPDRRVHAFSEQTKTVKLKDLVREALDKERMKGTTDQWARPERHPIHPEYTPEVEDQTAGDDKPKDQPKFTKETPVGAKKEAGEAKGIKLSGLVPMKALDQLRDKKTEKPKEIEEKQFEKDEHEGKVNDDDKQGLPLDMYKVDEIRFRSIVNTMIMESSAGEEAEKMGLVHKGWGRFADPKSGQVTHKSQDGKLVPIGQDEPAGGDTPEAPGAAPSTPPVDPAGGQPDPAAGGQPPAPQTTSPTGGRATPATSMTRSIGSSNPDRYTGAYAIGNAQEDLKDLGFEKSGQGQFHKSWKREDGAELAMTQDGWVVKEPGAGRGDLQRISDTAEMIDYIQDMGAQAPPEEEDEFSSEFSRDTRQQF